MAALPTDPICRLLATAQATIAALRADFGSVHARLADLQTVLAAVQTLVPHDDPARTTPDVIPPHPDAQEPTLELFALQCGGGRLLAIANDANQGRVEASDSAGGIWRITFAGWVDSFRLPDYARIPDHQVREVVITEALWDEQWLITGTLGDATVHIRLFGVLSHVERIAAGPASASPAKDTP